MYTHVYTTLYIQVPQTPRTGYSPLLDPSLRAKSCIAAEFWSAQETINWIKSTIQVDVNNNQSTTQDISKEDLNHAFDIWEYQGLNGKKLKEYAIEPNVFEQECTKWLISEAIIKKFYVNVLSLFVTFVVVDLINDENADSFWNSIIDDESEMKLHDRLAVYSS